MRHKWAYGMSDARNSRSRRCVRCWATGSRHGAGSTPWSTTLPDGTHRSKSIPVCPGTPWVRIEVDGDPVWVLRQPETNQRVRRIDRDLVRQFGREHVEEIIARPDGIVPAAPPLPEAAWQDLA